MAGTWEDADLSAMLDWARQQHGASCSPPWAALPQALPGREEKSSPSRHCQAEQHHQHGQPSPGILPPLCGDTRPLQAAVGLALPFSKQLGLAPGTGAGAPRAPCTPRG